MGSYRFVGTSGQIMDTPFVFRRYGQLVKIDDDLAEKSMANGFHLIPASEFNELGHADDHLKEWGHRPTHPDAPPAFVEARNKAWSKLSDRCVAILAKSAPVSSGESPDQVEGIPDRHAGEEVPEVKETVSA